MFLLAAGSKNSGFRKVWYGQKITSDEMLMAKKQRLERRWQSWIKNGYLKKVISSSPGATAAAAGTTLSSSGSKGKSSSAGESPSTGGSGEDSVTEKAGGNKPTKKETGGSGSSSSTDAKTSSYWEVLLSERSVVFSTGLVIGQLFGGPNLLQVVNRDEVAALDALCEWGCTESPNVLLGKGNLHADSLLPSQGVFSTEPWRGYLKTMLRHTLAFLPSDRWTFDQLEAFLIRLHAELATVQHAAVGTNPATGAGGGTEVGQKLQATGAA